ncbi:selenoprotein N-like [Scleropages formosus]|uniref:Selenoprotein N-like n=1 Tax=Scleropages formosus TaxID=113540 RepID=A0A0N8JXJ2_SCLFO|nr:selenoprotein N-like [Scleropages formosus]
MAMAAARSSAVENGAPRGSIRRPLLRSLIRFLLLAAAPLVAVGFAWYRSARLEERREAGLRALGAEGLFLFSSLDTDRDLYLSPEEFKPIAEKLAGLSPPAEFEEEEDRDPNGETLTVEARMQPLRMDTMTKSKDGFLGVTHSSLSGLRSWKSPAVPSTVISARQFRAFLPPKDKLDVGDAWWIVPSELNIFTGYLPNNRYQPPPPRGKEVIIHSLLSMFHPRPFIKTRFAPQGAVGCIRAASEIHAEFQLNDVPDFPFWFTPGQFTGHVLLSRDASHVREFHLYVPNDRSLNVDMEWLYGASESSNMEVDIGYLPQMELQATGPSVPTFIHDEEGNVIDSRVGGAGGDPVQFVFEEIHWKSEISREEAARRMEVTFYPFKKVEYLPFSEAFDRAQAEKKLVHSILLWGSGRTLRETVLESSPVLALLNQSFISSWSLVKELEDLQADPQNPTLSHLAALHLEKYNFPVEMMLALPNGTVVHHINANYFLDQTAMKPEEDDGTMFSFSGGFEDPSTSTYIRFLQEGLEKAKEYLEQ